jgi:hypothetical protein
MPDLSQLWQSALELVREHLLKALVGPLLVAVTGLWTWWLARRQMRLRAFLSRVNASLNILEPLAESQNGATHRLKLRTLFEMDVNEILLGNKAAVRMTLNAARQTSRDQPFLTFGDADDEWLILNAVLNEVSERFAAGLIAQESGVPTRKRTFLFGLTCEKDGGVRIQKLRIMLVSESTLRLVHEWARRPAPANLQEPLYESPHHAIRWHTLQTMANLCFEQQSKSIKRMEIVVAGP